MLNIFQNSYRRIFNVHFAVQGPYTMNHSLPLFLICFLHKSFPKWCKVFVDDDFLFLPRLELQWRHLTKFQILKCFLNLFSSCKVLIWSCHYIINFTIIAVSHLHYLFTSFSGHNPAQRECARTGLRSYARCHPYPIPQPVKVSHTTGVYDPFSFRIVMWVLLRLTRTNQWKCCETGPTVFRPYPRRLESLTICRCHYKGSTFLSVI